jgi:hypothetical protein
LSGPSLPSRIQRRLASLYGLDAPSVDDFVRDEESGREVVYVREEGDDLEIAVHLPRRALQAREVTLDDLCQVAEGVSHFLYIAERVRRRLPTTRLELELQAEVDKFVLLGGVVPDAVRATFDARRAASVRARLFDQVTYLHDAGSEEGERYRVASTIAARFSEKIARLRANGGAVVRALRDFYGAGQREKLEIAMAA